MSEVNFGLTPEELSSLSFEEIDHLVDGLDPYMASAILNDVVSVDEARLPASPIEQARELDSNFSPRPHLEYLSERISQAVHDVEGGQSRFLAISMPPRTGKTTLTTYYTPLWLLRKHPEWQVALISYDLSLVTSWGRAIRRAVEQHPLGIEIASDAGAVTEWETTKKGSVLSRTWRGQLTGRGVKVLIVDDPVKNAADASSKRNRDALWEWWLSVAQTRFEPPVLVIVVMTRWHEDDMTGRLLSAENEGNPDDWEVISFPAIAENNDVLGREPGEPLLSPLLEESVAEALERWNMTKKNVGSYTWSALYQQSPAPAEGAIFSTDWWRFWVSPEHAHLAKDRDNVIVMDLEEKASQGKWIDSWDMAFKALDTSDYVVGQRWVRISANRYLVHQTRQRLTFSQTLEELRRWRTQAVPYSSHVHRTIVEDKANGTAVIDVLKDEISGLIPKNPTNSKVARAQAITPEVESHNVVLPHPAMPGFEWVQDLLSELHNFPNDAHDDQVDALSQALTELRDAGQGGLSVPGSRSGSVNPLARRRISDAARTGIRRY